MWNNKSSFLKNTRMRATKTWEEDYCLNLINKNRGDKIILFDKQKFQVERISGHKWKWVSQTPIEEILSLS